MHSPHQSRVRIVFEVLCALTVSVSCVGTWNQTGATALLPAAAATLLYGFVRMFDMLRRAPARAMAKTVEMAAEQPLADEPPAFAAPVTEVAELAEPASPPARKARQTKTPRKKAKTAEVAIERANAVDSVLEEEPRMDEPMPFEEDHHASVTPLFEPVPFARQQRSGFGRKAGLAFPR